MKQPKSKAARLIQGEFKDSRICRIHYSVAHATRQTGNIGDAAAVLKSRPQCAPPPLLEMVF